jgi:hypothetical protein
MESLPHPFRKTPPPLTAAEREVVATLQRRGEGLAHLLRLPHHARRDPAPRPSARGGAPPGREVRGRARGSGRGAAPRASETCRRAGSPLRPAEVRQSGARRGQSGPRGGESGILMGPSWPP